MVTSRGRRSRRAAIALVGLVVAACGPAAKNRAAPAPAATMTPAATGASAATATPPPTATVVAPSPTPAASPTAVPTAAPLATATPAPAAAPPTPSLPVGLKPGLLAPDFRLPGVDGTPVASADLRATRKPYILFFFATW